MKKRMLSLLLSLAMVVSMMPGAAFALEAEPEAEPAAEPSAQAEEADEEEMNAPPLEILPTEAEAEEKAEEPAEAEEETVEAEEEAAEEADPVEEPVPAQEAPEAEPEEEEEPEAEEPVLIEDELVMEAPVLDGAPLEGVIASLTKWRLTKTEDLANFVLTLVPYHEHTPIRFNAVNDEGPWLAYRDYIVAIRFETEPGYGVENASVDSIGPHIFRGLTKVTSVELPSTVRSIDKEAFARLNSLESITLPEGLQSIGEGAFKNCTSLTEITLPSTLTSVDSEAFRGCGFSSLHIPAGLTEIGYGAFAPNSSDFHPLQTITVDAENPNYTVWDGMLFTKDMKTLVNCPAMKTGVVVVPEGVETIDRFAFAYCNDITQVNLPSTLTLIDEYAFQAFNYYGTSGCDSLTIPASVETIGSSAFQMAKIKDYTFLGSVKRIATCAFQYVPVHSLNIPEGISAIESLTFAGTGLEEFVIPFGVTEIGRSAFSQCRILRSITIPGTVTEIQQDAFQMCCALEEVHYQGTQEQWRDLLQTAIGVDYLVKANIFFEPQTIEGKVFITSGCSYGTTVSLGYDSQLTSLKNAGGLVYQWQYAAGDEFRPVEEVEDYGSVDEENRLTIGAGLIGKTIRLQITHPILEGAVVSAEKTVSKATAGAPNGIETMYFAPSYILIQMASEAEKAQEYLVLPKGTAPDAYWDKAVSGELADPSSVPGTEYTLLMNQDATGSYITAGNDYTIYTRMKETETHNAGTRVYSRDVYAGTAVYLNAGGLLLDGKPSGYSDSSRVYIDIAACEDGRITLPVEAVAAHTNTYSAHDWTSSADSLLTVVSVGETAGNTVSASGGSTAREYPTSVTLNVSGTGFGYIYADRSGSQSCTWPVTVYDSSAMTIDSVSALVDDKPLPSTSAYFPNLAKHIGDTLLPAYTKLLSMTPECPEEGRFVFRWYDGYYDPSILYGNKYVKDTDDSHNFIEVDPETGCVTPLEIVSDSPASDSDYAWVLLYIHDTKTDQEKQVARYYVDVLPALPKAESINLTRTELTLAQGKTYRLIPVISPYSTSANEITWSTSDPSVAEVAYNTGLVVGMGIGTATITAEVDGKTATCAVTVESGHVHMSVGMGVAFAPTCTTDGQMAYHQCSCGMYFEDSDCLKPIISSDITIPATGHSPAAEWSGDENTHWHACTNAGCTAKVDEAAHFPGDPADCEHDEVCPICNNVITPALGHSGVVTPAKAATCTEAGNTAYYTCSACGKFFSDAACTAEIAKDSWVIPAAGHSGTLTAAKAATCTEAGNSAYYTCSACGKFFSDEACTTEIAKDSWILPAVGAHTANLVAAKAATCGQAGNTAYYVCTVCGKFFSDEACTTEIAKDSWLIPGGAHTANAVAAKAATCSEAGNTAYYVCAVCGKFFSDAPCTAEIAENSWVIPVVAHTGGTATCTAKAKCSVCGQEYGDLLAHDYDTAWVNDTSSHWNKCKNCDAKTNIAAHSDSDTDGLCDTCGFEMKLLHTHSPNTVPAVAATCTEAGSSAYYTCPDCGKFFSDAACTTEIEKDSWIIAALGHTEGTAATCEAKAKCSVCGQEYGDLLPHADTDNNDTCDMCGKRISDIEELWVVAIPDQIWTGKAIKPVVTVYDGNHKLTLGIDYTVSYKNNKNEGNPGSVNAKGGSIAPTVLVKGKGNYSGTASAFFTIKKAGTAVAPQKVDFAVTAPTIAVNSIPTHTKAGAKPEITVMANGKKLVQGVDFTVSYKNNKAAGNPTSVNAKGGSIAPTVIIKGKGDYKGTASTTFTIAKATAVEYTVSDKGAVKVFEKASGKALTAKEFTVDKVSVPGSVIVKSAEGSSYSFASEAIKIPEKLTVKAALADPKAVHTYTGKPVTLEKKDLKVTVNKLPVKDADFEIVGYVNNVNKGSATVIIKTTAGVYATCKFKITAQKVPLIPRWNLIAALIGA